MYQTIIYYICEYQDLICKDVGVGRGAVRVKNVNKNAPRFVTPPEIFPIMPLAFVNLKSIAKFHNNCILRY